MNNALLTSKLNSIILIFLVFISHSNLASILTGHASQAARVNTLEVPAYRVYTLEELKEATDNFSSSNLIKTSPLAQVCSNRFL